jgi:hypothetical protein
MLLSYYQCRELFTTLSNESKSFIFDVDEPMRAKLFLEFAITNATQEILLYVDKICEEIFFSAAVFDVLKTAAEKGLSLKLISKNTETRFENVYSKYFNDFVLVENKTINFFDKEINENKEINPFFVIDTKSMFYVQKLFENNCVFHGAGCFFDPIISERLKKIFYENIVI